MKRIVLLMAVFSFVLLPVKPASAIVINLIEALDYYDDGILNLGDGFNGSRPTNLDNGVYPNYQSVFSGFFSLNNLSADAAFNISTTYSGVQASHYFTINDNPFLFYLNTNESALNFNDFFHIGPNTLTFHIVALSGSNLDDFDISRFDLSYNAAETAVDPEPAANNPVPEPATMFLFGSSLLGLIIRKRKV